LVLLAAFFCHQPLAMAGKRLAVTKFTGKGKAKIRVQVIKKLGSRYEVVRAEQVDARQEKLGLSAGCPGDGAKILARDLEADAVVCGFIRGMPFSRKLILKIYNGGDGALVKRLEAKMPGGKYSARKFANLGSALDRALEKTARPSTPKEDQATAAAENKPRTALKPIPELVKRLSFPDATDRIEALNELARHVHWQASIPLSCSMLGDADLNVRTIAASHLVNRHDAAVLSALRSAAVLEKNDSLKGIIRRVLTGLHQRVTDLVNKLQGADVNQRAVAARALGQGAYQEALPHLIKAVNDPNPGVRMYAAEGLRHFSTPAARTALAKAAKDGHPTVRGVAQRFIQEGKRLKAWRAFYMSYMKIVKKADSARPAWREEALVAIGLNAATNAVQMIIQKLQNDQSEQVRLAAAWSLAVLGTAPARAALARAAANDPSHNLKRVIRQYLDVAKINKDDLKTKLTHPGPEIRQLAAETLALRPSEDVVHPLARSALCDADAGVRKSSLRGLAQAATPLAIEVIKLAMFRDASDEVRNTAMMMFVLKGHHDEPEPEPTYFSKETRAWAKDDEDPIQRELKLKAAAEQKRKEQERVTTTPRCPLGCDALRISVGVSSLFIRDYSLDGWTHPLDAEGSSSTIPVAGFDVSAEVFPGAWFTKGWLANFGVGLRYARFFGLSWKAKDGSTPTTDITHDELAVDALIIRWQPVRQQKIPTIFLKLGVRLMNFAMNDEDTEEAYIPDINITAFDVGLGLKVPMRSAHMMIGFDYLHITEWGEITDADEYGAGDGLGFRASLGFGGPFNSFMGWKLEASYTRLMLDFASPSTAKRVAESAADQYLYGRISLVFNI